MVSLKKIIQNPWPGTIVATASLAAILVSDYVLTKLPDVINLPTPIIIQQYRDAIEREYTAFYNTFNVATLTPLEHQEIKRNHQRNSEIIKNLESQGVEGSIRDFELQSDSVNRANRNKKAKYHLIGDWAVAAMIIGGAQGLYGWHRKVVPPERNILEE